MTKQEFLRDLKGLLPEGEGVAIILEEADIFYFCYDSYLSQFLDNGQSANIKGIYKNDAVEALESFSKLLPENLQGKLEDILLSPEGIILQLEKD